MPGKVMKVGKEVTTNRGMDYGIVAFSNTYPRLFPPSAGETEQTLPSVNSSRFRHKLPSAASQSSSSTLAGLPR